MIVSVSVEFGAKYLFNLNKEIQQNGYAITKRNFL